MTETPDSPPAPAALPDAAALPIDPERMVETLLELLEIPSPSGYTDRIVHRVGQTLQDLEIPFELTRRGAIRARIAGRRSVPDRALVAHLDTLGAMVTRLKKNGRLAVAPIGTWSARFAEGSRVTILGEHGSRRGTILPLKASGHVFGDDIDTQPVGWDHVEIRVDDHFRSHADAEAMGFRVGDFVAIDPAPEVTDTGFVLSRHLDDKAGVACLLEAVRVLRETGIEPPVDTHLLFTIFEEVGTGASSVLHRDVAEMVAIDNATPAPGQRSSEVHVNIAMMDSSGPFDYHLRQKLIGLCRDHDIPLRRDVFRYYRCDAAAAVEAGNDIRTALVCFGVDSSHGWERTHIDGLVHLAHLLVRYMASAPTFERDRRPLGPLAGFPDQPVEPAEAEHPKLRVRQPVVEEVDEE